MLSEAKLQPGKELRYVAKNGFVDEVKRVITSSDAPDVDDPDDKVLCAWLSFSARFVLVRAGQR